MKRILLTLSIITFTCFTIAGEIFSVGKYSFEVITSSQVKLSCADKSISSANISSTITYQNVTYSVISIGDQAFMDCSSLTSIRIPNSVTSIGNFAFSRCSSLLSITIPNSLLRIGVWAFEGCSSLVSITLPDGIKRIGDMAFMGCSSLVSISIPSSIVSIGAHAFLLTGIYEDQSNWDAGALYVSNCLIAVDPNLVGDYTIRPDTRLIADQALSACNNLTSITIPHSVTCIGSWAFSGHYSTTAVNYAGTKQQWNKISLNTDWNKNSNIQIIHCTDGDFYL